jgi:hypothetical protein
MTHRRERRRVASWSRGDVQSATRRRPQQVREAGEPPANESVSRGNARAALRAPLQRRLTQPIRAHAGRVECEPIASAAERIATDRRRYDLRLFSSAGGFDGRKNDYCTADFFDLPGDAFLVAARRGLAAGSDAWLSVPPAMFRASSQ